MKCIICGKSIEKHIRCIPCYCDPDNDKKVDEYLKK